MENTSVKVVQVTKFSGHSHEDPVKFLDELDSYLILHGIKLNAADRRCAALHLHLTGPALSWYQRLNDQVKFNWQTLRTTFLDQYNNANRTYGTDVEKFHTLILKPSQRIEDFYACVLDLGTRLKLADRDIMYRFIAGLPERLGFFVRAGRPVDHTQALESALSGAACGYNDCTQDTNARAEGLVPQPIISGSYAHTSAVGMDQLLKTIEKLSLEVEQLRNSTTQNTRRYGDARRQQNNVTDTKCAQCHGRGHSDHDCRWNREGRLTPDVKCQICKQFGHTAVKCADRKN